VYANDLSSHIRSAFSARTNGSTQVFSRYVSGTTFARNRAFWLRGLNGLTGIHAGYGPGATAITRWHVIGANHWKHDAGSKLFFCALQDQAVVRTVVAGTEIRPDVKSDIWLAVLDQPLPSSIVPNGTHAGRLDELDSCDRPARHRNEQGFLDGMRRTDLFAPRRERLVSPRLRLPQAGP
jgi:hypothetical protein